MLLVMDRIAEPPVLTPELTLPAALPLARAPSIAIPADFNTQQLRMSLIQIRSRLRESVILEPLLVGDSRIELKIEIYEALPSAFSSKVYSKETYLIEPAFMEGVPKEEDRRSMVDLFVEDLHYTKTGNSAISLDASLMEALHYIHAQLLKAGQPIEYIKDLTFPRSCGEQ